MLTGNRVFWKKFKVYRKGDETVSQVCAKRFSQSEFFYAYGHD